MNSLIQHKTTILTLLVTVVLSCFGLSPSRAVIPAPDGGYPGGNTAEGQASLLRLTTGGFNTAVGYLSLGSNTAGQFNTGVGAGTLLANTGDRNTATGTGALLGNTTGFDNTVNGVFALPNNTTGSDNMANGFEALLSNTTGIENTASGAFALLSNTTGDDNTAVGESTLAGSTTGSFNTALGVGAGNNVTTATNVIAIGSLGANVTNSCFIGNIRGATTQNNDAVPVLIDSAGQLGTGSSSCRYKTDIKPMDKASESILALKPVSFRYKVHKDGTAQFGLIAEDVAEVNPNLVIYDADGKPYTVRYEAVNAMLLNEFLKEHSTVEEQSRKIQEQDATIGQLKSGMEALTATVKEQASQIQKVSAQLEASKPAPQVVNNQ